MERLAVRCHAKINTVLLVLGARADGYHELDTEFVSLALHDLLVIEPRSAGFELEVEGAGDVPVDDNLVLRAAQGLQGELGEEAVPGARFRLEKRIPAAAGLGGGSSDAAGAVLGLCRLFGLSPPEGLLRELALDLGSDVPCFLSGGRQRGRGRGELLTPLSDGPSRPVLLLVPHERLSTAAVFRRHAALARAERRPDGQSTAGVLTSRKTGHNFDAGSWWQATDHGLRNDLRDAAFELAPRLAEVEERLLAVAPPERVGLTGSGPTLFALLGHGEATERIETQRHLLERDDALLILTRTLGRREVDDTRFAPPRGVRDRAPGG
jgi:4-diphosphocytidyl-2-C-methyl-D-erythritol kinase